MSGTARPVRGGYSDSPTARGERVPFAGPRISTSTSLSRAQELRRLDTIERRIQECGKLLRRDAEQARLVLIDFELDDFGTLFLIELDVHQFRHFRVRRPPLFLQRREWREGLPGDAELHRKPTGPF